MKVLIKSFDVAMEVKQRGVELEVRAPAGDHHGDCYVTMTGLIWCKGRTSKAHGVRMTWDQLMEVCGSKQKLKAAIAAAKQV